MKVSVFIAQSLDGFIARPDGGLDWLPGATDSEGADAKDGKEAPGATDSEGADAKDGKEAPGATDSEVTVDQGSEQSEPAAEEIEDHGYGELMDSIDALLMGRNTYEIVAGLDMDWPYPKPVYVLSRSLKESDIVAKAKDKVKLIQGKPEAVLEQMANDGVKHIYLDGGATIQEFLRQGLVTEMTITTVPVLIGQGIPLFGALEKDIKLETISSQVYKPGLISSKFKVIK